MPQPGLQGLQRNREKGSSVSGLRYKLQIQTEEYKEEMNEVFNDFNEIIDNMLNNNGDKKDIEERMEKIYNKINKPIE